MFEAFHLVRLERDELKAKLAVSEGHCVDVVRSSDPFAEALALLPHAQVVWVSATARVIRSDEKAFLVATGLYAPAQYDFELWVLRAGEQVAAGLLYANEHGLTVKEVPADVDDYVITLEPEGGGIERRGSAI